jgi:hypothetical protein
MSSFPSSIPSLSLAALSAAVLTLASQPTRAQSHVVDVDDGVLVQPPSVAFPFYTPGGGVLGYTTRAQTFCPPTFAGLQPIQRSLVTHVALQLAGREVYDVFTLRAGATTVPALTHSFAVNLPDQRPHVDLRSITLEGGVVGNVPTNQWVTFALDRPFVWSPGEGVVVDVTAKIAFTDRYCTTGTSPNLQRLTDQDHQGGATGTLQQSNGLKFRLTLEPLDVVRFGTSCAGSGGGRPTLGSSGDSTLGSANYALTLTGALPNAPTALLFGASRRSMAGGVTLPFAFGGGCAWRTSADVALAVVVAGGAPGQGTANAPLAIPNAPELQGQAFYVQWAQLDFASGATAPVTTSEGGIVVIR